MWLNRTSRAVENMHLVYLGLLPALATFSVLVNYGHPAPMLLFLGGVVAVSVYLAVVASYTRSTNSLGVALFVLLDGPFWAALSYAAGGVLFSFAIDAFLIDGVAIWLAIVWLAVSTSRPTRGQRIATIGFALIAVGTVLFAFWLYLYESVFGDWLRFLFLVMGVVEAFVARHYLLKVDKVVRGTMSSARYILVFLFIWIAATCAGNVLRELGSSLSHLGVL
jgi:hypothetical protein